MTKNKIINLYKKQSDFFNSHKTKSLDFRIQSLKKLKSEIIKNEDKILKALEKDLGKCDIEAYISEIFITLGELNLMLKNIKKWSRPKKVKTPLTVMPGKSYIFPEPFGRVLIIAPWNYPFQLLMTPLMGALAAGNTVILKPSELSPHTSKIISKIIKNCFDEKHIAVVNGAVKETQILLDLKFDYIFYTGSTSVGKIIMEKAAKNLTPVTLELGGKSPCVVCKDADIKKTARRIVTGKLYNAGQTCIGVDYVLVQKEVKNELLEELKNYIHDLYGPNTMKNKDFGKIINEKQFNRLIKYLKNGKIFFGGESSKKNLHISPTILTKVKPNSPVMTDEIFGPILPIITFEALSEAIDIINSKPKPLALYIFSKSKIAQKRILFETSSGGVCINGTLEHYATHHLPFGGVGESGMGAYHGKASFETFTYFRGTLIKNINFDFKEKYAPYKLPLKLFKKALSLLI